MRCLYTQLLGSRSETFHAGLSKTVKESTAFTAQILKESVLFEPSPTIVLDVSTQFLPTKNMFEACRDNQATVLDMRYTLSSLPY